MNDSLKSVKNLANLDLRAFARTTGLTQWLCTDAGISASRMAFVSSLIAVTDGDHSEKEICDAQIMNFYNSDACVSPRLRRQALQKIQKDRKAVGIAQEQSGLVLFQIETGGKSRGINYSTRYTGNYWLIIEAIQRQCIEKERGIWEVKNEVVKREKALGLASMIKRFLTPLPTEETRLKALLTGLRHFREDNKNSEYLLGALVDGLFEELEVSTAVQRAKYGRNGLMLVK